VFEQPRLYAVSAALQDQIRLKHLTVHSSQLSFPPTGCLGGSHRQGILSESEIGQTVLSVDLPSSHLHSHRHLFWFRTVFRSSSFRPPGPE
jgi:hypothetical protein